MENKVCVLQDVITFSLHTQSYMSISGKDSCSGDSGGPLLSYEGVNDLADLKYLRGIISFGGKKCGNVSISQKKLL